VARHDAVAWGYGRGADQRGVEIHQQTEVLGIDVQAGKVKGVQTSRGYIATNKVLCAVAGSTPRILKMVDVKSPIYIHPLQAMVSEPIKPWLDPILVSGSLHVHQPVGPRRAGDGRLLDPYELHGTRSTLDFVEGLTTHMLEMFPFLSNVKVMRQWAGMADMTPTSLRSWARPRWKASTWIPAGAPGASRPRRCAARPWPTPWSMTPTIR
jgi:sarcosine oxidase subunit beta